MDGTVSIRTAGEADFDVLTDIWERAARSSHAFMDPGDFDAMRPFIRDSYLPSMDVLLAEAGGATMAFVGSRADHVELLYVDLPCHGQGVGTALLSEVGPAGATSVEVYADNTTGVGFYRSRGFVEIGRHELDAAGRPYPILVLRR
ncbi:MAG: family N-acetyltransferase [Aeromicrobium sp.]|nr:family N-acetyltransferase [Aeromicrobium sp.]